MRAADSYQLLHAPYTAPALRHGHGRPIDYTRLHPLTGPQKAD
jgi:hypothetical protein